MMEITKYKWQQTGEHKNFVYALNDRGTNAFCFNVQGANDPAVERAVATLACAAPLLLEALKDALKSVEFERCNFRPWHNKARAAIAAAEGE
jgi:hypothetical protein